MNLFSPNDTLPVHRTVSYITLIQAGVVVGGTLFVAAMCKANGYGTVPDERFNSTALFIRRSGWILLLLPACWATCTLALARRDEHPRLVRALIAIGVASILFGINAYAQIGCSPGISAEMPAGTPCEIAVKTPPR